jgi:C4-dicarboxylate-specific signal transduction histidine kinase
MAEVATGVLHNVGNVLNSVNVSATIICERIRKSEVSALSQVSELLRQHQNNIGDFLAYDPKGRLVHGFIHRLSIRLQDEHAETLRELKSLAKNVEHINNIVVTQQGYARFGGFIESLSAADLIEDALQINATEFQRHNVEVTRSFEEVPRVAVDRHKVLQILINLLSNAKYAIDENGSENRRIVIGVASDGRDTVQITVVDTGIGIPSENLTKIFSHGFTTKKNGHGFGLHSSAIAAKQMGGSLSAFSDGPGTGAGFSLKLPIARETNI